MVAERNSQQLEKRNSFWSAIVRARTIEATRLLRQTDRRFF